MGATALAGAAKAATPPAQGATTRTGGGPNDQAALAAVAALVETHRRELGLPGMTVAIVDRAGLDARIRSGFADLERGVPVGPDHLFQVGSIGKMFTGLTAYSLFGEGRLDPDARLAALLPGVKIDGGEAITLQHLLDHTSGLPGNAPVFGDDGLWVGTEPGTQWAYSNTGYHLAGLAIARAAGVPNFREAAEARVLRPLGMTASAGGIAWADRARHAQGYTLARPDLPRRPRPALATAPWADVDFAAGSVTATADDMASFLRFLSALAQGRGGPVLTDAAAARFVAHAADAPGWAKGASYGSGVARTTVEGRPYWHHTGGMPSFSSSLHLDPETGIAAYASSNVGYPLGYRPRDVTLFAVRALRATRAGEALSEAPSPTPKLPAERLAAIAGIYRNRAGESFEIRATDGALTIVRDSRSSALLPTPGGLVADDPRFAATALEVDADEKGVRRLWAGSEEFAKGPDLAWAPETPTELKVYEGRYDSDSPWGGVLRVVARGGKLVLSGAGPLKKGPGDLWLIDEPDAEAERVRFGAWIDGRPHSLAISGERYGRRFS